MDQQHFPLYAPGDILSIKEIDHRDIVLFMVIFGMMRLEGYCWATNEYLCNRMGWSERSLQRSLKILQGAELIRVVVDGPNRKIYPVKYDAYPVKQSQTTPSNLSGSDDPSIFLINKHNKHTSKHSFESEILEAYKNYPLKKGKTIGVKKLSKQIKTPEQLSELQIAIRNYTAECKGKDQQYIKHFSTFASCWEDYVTVEKKKSDFVVVNLVDGEDPELP
jgi:hypothetical protein